MRIKVIACKVMLRQLYGLAAKSKNTVDIMWIEQKLHDEPDLMRKWLQDAIDRVEAEREKYDAIVLAYGLCSNGTAGLKSKNTPLVLARGHDCITLLLGSKERYAELFKQGNGGIYWYSQGWVENAVMPGKDRYDAIYKEYLEKYGEDNAEYLLEMEQGWMREYSHAIYIRWPDDDGKEERYTKESAEFLKWNFDVQEGDTSLLRDLLDGPWDDKRFLVVPPGHAIAPSYDEGVVCCHAECVGD